MRNSTITGPSTATLLRRHVDDHAEAIASLEREFPRLLRWGDALADAFLDGRRLLAAGNGGSAAEAQHLTAEFVGRFDGERRAFSAIALHAESSAVTAIGNDYGFESLFARQVAAHGREGDVLVLLSTSGRSPNLVAAARTARSIGVRTWALTGAGPNPLTRECDDAIALAGSSPGVQEAHLVAVHLLCRIVDDRIDAHDREDAS